MTPIVLIDSSAWISYFLGQPSRGAQSVKRLLQAHRVATNAIVRIELLTGARDEAQYAGLDDTLAGLHGLELTPAVWRRAERLRFDLRRGGHLVPLTDVVIACCALAYDCQLLHLDHHFEYIAHATPLKIYRPTE